MVTVASSTRMPMARAMPPSDMMLIVLPVDPQPEQRAQQGQRDVGHHHDHAAQVAQEQQDHQAGQAGADQPLGRHALDRRHHRRRLVELEVRPSRPCGTASRNSRASTLWTSATTVSVEPVSFLMIGR